MHDRSIAKLSLAMAIAGLSGLFLVNLLLVPTALAVGDIDQSELGRIVSVSATISDISIKDGHIFITLSDGGSEVRAVMWESVARGTDAYNLMDGDAVTVIGQIASYRGELEIVVSRIARQI